MIAPLIEISLKVTEWVWVQDFLRYISFLVFDYIQEKESVW